MPECPIGQCSDSVECSTKVDYIESSVDDLRHDVVRVSDRIDTNTRWLIGLFITINVEAIAFVISVFQLISSHVR